MTTECPGAQPATGHVRLVYHYRDGHDVITDPMLRAEAVAYMPLLRAVRMDAEHYEAGVASIEIRSV